MWRRCSPFQCLCRDEIRQTVSILKFCVNIAQITWNEQLQTFSKIGNKSKQWSAFSSLLLILIPRSKSAWCYRFLSNWAPRKFSAKLGYALFGAQSAGAQFAAQQNLGPNLPQQKFSRAQFASNRTHQQHVFTRLYLFNMKRPCLSDRGPQWVWVVLHENHRRRPIADTFLLLSLFYLRVAEILVSLVCNIFICFLERK